MPNWAKIEKRLPSDDRQVFALSGKYAQIAFYQDGKWWLTSTITLGGVTRWMEIPGEPKDLDYWLKLLRKWWGRRKAQASGAGDRLRGWTSTRSAQLSKKPAFFFNSSTGEVRTGLPAQYGTPIGFQRIECTSARDAERWSERQRRLEGVEHQRMMEARAAVEGPMRDEIHKELHHKMANARNQVNRDFLRRAIERAEARPDSWQSERVSYLHSEGYEERR